MLASLLLLSVGCVLRVASEIPAYEANFALARLALPVSAVTEMGAVSLFAVNLLITFSRPARTLR